jgi:hypothetical protein
MDEGKLPISPNELNLRPASGWTAAVVDSCPADLAKSDDLVAREQQRPSGQIDPCRNDSSDGRSAAVYYRNEEEVSKGFLIALRAMGVAVVEQPPEPAKPPVARAEP